MQKTFYSIFSIFTIGLIAVLVNSDQSKQSNIGRSIASTSQNSYVANEFLVEFKNKNISTTELSKFAIKHSKVLVNDSGKLGVIISEYNENHSHEMHYFLIKDNGETAPIELASEPDVSMIGKRVAFSGFHDNGKQYGSVNKIPQYAELIESKFTTQKMLILFFKFDTSPRARISMIEAQAVANDAYRRIFNDMTDSKVRHDIKVSGWHHLSRDENALGGFGICNVSNEEIRDAIAADGLDPIEFDNISIISNCDSYHTIGGHATLSAYDWLGVGKSSTYVRMASNSARLKVEVNPDVPGWTSFVSILVHERGHNFGLGHSNALDCGSNPFLQSCTTIEYGNKFDRMGGPDSSYTFNADQQRKAGWKNEIKDFHHIKTTGTYVIDRLTESNPNRKIGAYLYLPGTNKKMMMIEYRQAHKFDNRLGMWIFREVPKGVHLYSVMGNSDPDKSPTIGTQFKYIDSNPTELDWHADTAYESMSSSYFDPLTGATINMSGVSGTKAVIYVEFDPAKQVCFKKVLKDKVARPFVTRYTPIGELPADMKFASKPKPSRFIKSNKVSTAITARNSIHIKKKHIVLVPGDDFKIRHESLLADALLCPRSALKVQWLNGSNFFTWVKPIIDPGGSTSGSSGSIGTRGSSGNIGSTGGSPDGMGIPIGGGGGSTPTSFNTIVSFSNYTKEYSFHPEMTVPQGTLGNNYILNFKAKDTATNEEILFQVYLHIRATHDAIIPLDPEENSESF